MRPGAEEAQGERAGTPLTQTSGRIWKVDLLRGSYKVSISSTGLNLGMYFFVPPGVWVVELADGQARFLEPMIKTLKPNPAIHFLKQRHLKQTYANQTLHHLFKVLE